MGSRRIRILYLTSCWPLDKAFGGQLRALQIGRALQGLGEVTLAVVASDAAEDEVVRNTAEEFQVEPPVRVTLRPNRSVVSRLRWAFDPRFLNVHGCTAGDDDRARVLSLAGQHDLTWISESRTANVMNVWRWPDAVLDAGDLPSMYQRTVWRSSSDLIERLRARVMMLLLKRRELCYKERFDTLSVCSDSDKQYLGGGSQIHVIPNGFARPTVEPVRNVAHPPRLGFIGLYSYPPNLEGMRWFLRECWPLLRRELPGVRLRLVGKDTDGPLRPPDSDVDALGWVADPAQEIGTWSAMVIPVRRGGGTRVKLVDAFSRKCPVVSTSTGAFGYDVEHGRELYLADDAGSFAAACRSMVRNTAAASVMAERAYQAFLKKWTWEAVAPRVAGAAETIIRKRVFD